MIVVLAAILFTATAATGIVAAAPAGMALLPEGTINLVPGSYVQTTAHLYNMFADGSPHVLDVIVVIGDASDLTFKVTDPFSGTTSGPTTGGITHMYTPPAGTTEYDVVVEIMVATGTEGKSYKVEYVDVQTGVFDEGSLSVPLISIPEFATIAVPVAAVIGLLFFFNHRKHKKE